MWRGQEQEHQQHYLRLAVPQGERHTRRHHDNDEQIEQQCVRCSVSYLIAVKDLLRSIKLTANCVLRTHDFYNGRFGGPQTSTHCHFLLAQFLVVAVLGILVPKKISDESIIDIFGSTCHSLKHADEKMKNPTIQTRLP